MRIAMTGASGNMGTEALKQTIGLKNVEWIRILLLNTKKDRRYAKHLLKLYGNKVQLVFGSITEETSCVALVKDADYIIHMAAVIPPKSDAAPQDSYLCNAIGTETLVKVILRDNANTKFIYISTVALYGNRNEKHPFGRVGDPLIVSPFDAYAKDKLYGERCVLDAELPCWVILRQTAMLHPNIFKDNLSDGLMFHTALNAPLEWVSSRDSGYLIKRIIERDGKNEIPQFWKKIYNIGAGEKGRRTGYDTFNDGFAMIGGTTEKYFQPNWFSARNFHGMWFADSDELNDLFGYQRDSVQSYWQEIADAHPVFALGRFIPKKLFYLFLFRRLLRHPNSPQAWIKRGDKARIAAYFGGKKKLSEMPTRWKDTKLITKGDFGDPNAMKKTENAVLPSHGYDENKSPENWTIDDMRKAAAFRGGKCLSDVIDEDIYKKIYWQCAEGHTFESSPYTVLRGGHWCPHCCMPSPWRFDHVAKKAPFYAQVWYDSHDKDENNFYEMDNDGNVSVRKDI